jgi:hypothetical protein
VVFNSDLRKRGRLQPEGGDYGRGGATTRGLERAASRPKYGQASRDIVKPLIVHD